MAFALATFAQASVGHPSATGKVWSYTTATDAKATVAAANYWAGAYARGARAGDYIFATCSDGGMLLYVSALAAATSTVVALGDAATIAAAQAVWVGPITCTGYGTAGRVGSFVAPIAGTISTLRHITDTVVTADNVLNLDIGGTNVTGGITVAVSDTAVDIIDSGTATADNVVTAGALVVVESDGAGDTGAGRLWVKITP